MQYNVLDKKIFQEPVGLISKLSRYTGGYTFFSAMLIPLVTTFSAHGEIWTVATVTDVQFVENRCDYWYAHVTISAVPYAESQVKSWSWNFRNYSAVEHVHQSDDGLSYGSFHAFSSSPEDIRGRLSEVNKAVLGQENPPVGASNVVTHYHNGLCAADFGNQECIGLFLGNDKSNFLPQGGRPVSIPAGVCWGVPIPNRYCEWGNLSLTIDHGTVTKNKESVASENVTLTCHGTTTYKVKLISPLEDVTLLINNQPLGSTFKSHDSGTQNVTFTSIIKPSVAGAFQRSGVLLVSPE